MDAPERGGKRPARYGGEARGRIEAGRPAKRAPGEGDGYDLEAMRTLSVGWHSGYEETVAQTGRKCKHKRALGAPLRAPGSGFRGNTVL
jgi:hypothetical protein